MGGVAWYKLALLGIFISLGTRTGERRLIIENGHSENGRDVLNIGRRGADARKSGTKQGQSLQISLEYKDSQMDGGAAISWPA